MAQSDDGDDCGFRTGDLGQRYEVQAETRDGQWEPIGWTESPDGGSLADGARMWPRYKCVRIIDRYTGEETIHGAE